MKLRNEDVSDLYMYNHESFSCNPQIDACKTLYEY